MHRSFLDELDNLDDDRSGAEVDQELLTCVRETNQQMDNINSNLQRRRHERAGTDRVGHERVGTEVAKTGNEFGTSTPKEELSLDALEDFLGALMVEAAGDEKGNNTEGVRGLGTRNGRLGSRDRGLGIKDGGGGLDIKDGSKYKLIMPVLKRIGKMVSQHPTHHFESYHEHLSKLEAAIRVGERNVDGYDRHDSDVSDLDDANSLSSSSTSPPSSSKLSPRLEFSRSAPRSVSSSSGSSCDLDDDPDLRSSVRSRDFRRSSFDSDADSQRLDDFHPSDGHFEDFDQSEILSLASQSELCLDFSDDDDDDDVVDDKDC